MTNYPHDVCRNCGGTDFESVGLTYESLLDFERTILRCTACDTYHSINKVTGLLSVHAGEIFPFSKKTNRD